MLAHPFCLLSAVIGKSFVLRFEKDRVLDMTYRKISLLVSLEDVV